VEKTTIDYFEVIARSVAHELRTSLTTIKSGIEGVKDYIPLLIEAYQTAASHGLAVPEIKTQHLNMLMKALDFSEKAAFCTSSYVNMLVTNMTKINPELLTFETCSINECLKETIKQFPYKSEEQENLIVNSSNIEKDFLFKGNKHLIINLLLNLLKNALYHIQDAAKGKITIWTETTDTHNFLYIKDTGKGINPAEINLIFNPFYGAQQNNIGMGLYFCKELMHALQGDITCTSDEGIYCQFTLSFPLLSTC